MSGVNFFNPSSRLLMMGLLQNSLNSPLNGPFSQSGDALAGWMAGTLEKSESASSSQDASQLVETLLSSQDFKNYFRNYLQSESSRQTEPVSGGGQSGFPLSEGDKAMAETLRKSLYREQGDLSNFYIDHEEYDDIRPTRTYKGAHIYTNLDEISARVVLERDPLGVWIPEGVLRNDPNAPALYSDKAIALASGKKDAGPSGWQRVAQRLVWMQGEDGLQPPGQPPGTYRDKENSHVFWLVPKDQAALDKLKRQDIDSPFLKYRNYEDIPKEMLSEKGSDLAFAGLSNLQKPSMLRHDPDSEMFQNYLRYPAVRRGSVSDEEVDVIERAVQEGKDPWDALLVFSAEVPPGERVGKTTLVMTDGERNAILNRGDKPASIAVKEYQQSLNQAMREESGIATGATTDIKSSVPESSTQTLAESDDTAGIPGGQLRLLMDSSQDGQNAILQILLMLLLGGSHRTTS